MFISKLKGKSDWIMAVLVSCCLILTGVIFSQRIDKNTGASNHANGVSAHALALVEAEIHAQQNELLNSCIRLNIVRALDNSSHYSDYKTITQQIRFQSTSLRSNYLALRRIGLPKRILNRALKQAIAALASQRAQANTKEWVPLTNCTAIAISSGGTYLPPLPISFAAGPPPASALNSLNARNPDPVGSLP